MVSHVQVTTEEGKENTLIEGKRKWGGRNKQRPWFFIDSAVARKKEESFFFLLGSALVAGQEGSPFWSLSSI